MSTFEASLIEYGEKLKVEEKKETARSMLKLGMNDRIKCLSVPAFPLKRSRS